jgi:NAD(P)-dependent dehydrogenase (short-subunit alcohol dehydrogenase family)
MNKVWFVTGASSGLGEALTAAIIQRGDQVAATFRKAEQASLFTQQAGNNGLGLVLDVTDEAQRRAAVQQALQHFGHIDVLVNNAGYGTVGAIALTKEVLPLMREAGAGHIVQISSVSGFRAIGGFGLYNASKFALEGFSEALAQEVAPFGIRVVIVEPGPVRTQFAGSSIRLAQHRIDAYAKTPVHQMYQYINRVDGQQEGDPVKAGNAIVDYVHNGNKELRLPLGRAAIQGIKAKLAAVQADLAANEPIALSTLVEGA